MNTETPVEDKKTLISYMERGAKSPSRFAIGTEHEKLVFNRNDLSPASHKDICRILQGLTAFGWQMQREEGLPIGLKQRDMAVSLEPGGQFELSGAPLETLHETWRETNTYLQQVRQVTQDNGLGLLGLGFSPKWPRHAFHWMPKARYRIMRAYMPTRGAHGLDMMCRTCTVQTNLDFSSEADMVRKMRVALALQPVATALMANSPFCEDAPSGFLSLRSLMWTDTDPDRCGDLPWVFAEGMGFERYVDYMLDVPMYFVHRGDTYIDASGQSFREFMRGNLPALPREIPVLRDFVDHLTTAFPEVRLKQFIEMRGADVSADVGQLCGVSALWTGLLYDTSALDAAWDLIKDWSAHERTALRANVPRLALKTPFRRGITVQDLALRVLEVARHGLQRRDRRDERGQDESIYLERLQTIAESGHTAADELLRLYHTTWNQAVDPVYTVASF